jgi:hypothetical protein
MSTRKVSKLVQPTVDAVVEEYNALVTGLGHAGLLLHYEETPVAPVTSADATDLATALVLANEVKADLNTHMADTKKHLAADATNPTTEADATDQSTLNTLVNAIKDDIDAHQLLLTSHRGSGGPGGVTAAPIAQTAADATDAATSVTLVNALKDQVNLHARNGAQNLNVSGT